MPYDRTLYPDNWDQLASQVKDAANWTCQECGRPCRKPGVRWGDFAVFLNLKHPQWFIAEVLDQEPKPQRFTLTVSHQDQNPSNNDPANLRALCSVCHLEYDKSATQQFRRRQVNLERQGQIRLLD